jgi:hypothetical protein
MSNQSRLPCASPRAFLLSLAFAALATTSCTPPTEPSNSDGGPGLTDAGNDVVDSGVEDRTDAGPPAPRPLRINSVTPGAGPAAGGTPVVVAGSGFEAGGVSVTFAGVPATSVAVHADGVLTAVTPPGSVGAADVSVAIADVATATLPGAFRYEAADTLALVSVQPAEGPVEGGGIAVLRGQGFKTGAVVRFGDALARDVDVASPSILTCSVPRGPVGVVDVTVTNPDGAEARLTGAFTRLEAPRLAVAAVTPDEGSTLGGELVLVTGAGFLPGITATLGGVDVEVLDVPADDTLLLVTAPSAPGIADLTVTLPDGQQATLARAFAFVIPPDRVGQAPAPAAVLPAVGPEAGGTPAQVVGSGFAPGAVVRFGAQPVETRFIDATRLVVRTPAGAGVVGVTVTNPDGQVGGLTAAFTFVAPTTAAPTVAAVVPTSGPSTGGTRALVTGAGFLPGARVLVGDRAATDVAFIDGSQLLCSMPAGVVGSASVVVVNEDGQSAALADAFAYYFPGTVPAPAPVITSVSPRAGFTAGGERVAIVGAGFGAAPLVLFGDAPATVVSTSGGAVVEVITPPGRAGTTPVTLTTAQGMSFTIDAGFVYFEQSPSVVELVPPAGPTAGGTTVKLRGAHFDDGAIVRVDSVAVPATFVSPRELVLTMPPHAAGRVGVRVTNPDGLFDVLDDAYAYAEPEPPVPPAVDALSPVTGPAAGGIVVVVSGEGLRPGSTVSFGGTPSPEVRVYNDALLTALSPAGEPDTTVDITVTAPDGTSTQLPRAFTFTSSDFVAPLAFSGVVPGEGPVTGGTTVTLTGSGFVPGMAVTFGLAPAQAVVFVSPTVLTVVTPASTAGVADVVLRRPDQSQVVAFDGFVFREAVDPTRPRPTVASATPGVGPVAGGTLVVVDGSGFVPGAVVRFGGLAATDIAVVSSTQLTARTPASGTGTVTLSVENPDGGAAVLATGFTFFEPTGLTPPRVLSAVPFQGSALGGDAIDVFGAGFRAGVSVLVCGRQARVDEVTSERVRVTTPAGPLGPCDVVAVNADGLTGTLAGGFRFVPPVPTLVDLVPSTGDRAGGARVLVRGTGFLPEATVFFGSARATTIEVWDPQTLVAVAPAAAPGTVNVRVVNPGGVDAVLNAAFTYVEVTAPPVPPTLTAVTPSRGPAAGGTPVEVRGSGFRPGIAVLVGGRAPAAVEIVDATLLTLLTPPGAEGAVAVTVLNNDGLGATLVDAFAYEAPVVAAPRLIGVTPATGPAAGSTAITVSGQNLLEGGALYVGASRMASVAIVGGNLATGLTPRGNPGPADVLYVGPDGQFARLEDAFTFVSAPTLQSVSPDFGPVRGGSELTLLGADYQPGASVFFGTERAQVLASTSTRLTVVTPPTSTAGAVDVRIVNPDGQSVTAVRGFRYLLAPVVSSVQPTTGPEAGGTLVRVQGSNMFNGAVVTFGGRPASQVIFVDETTLFAVSPAAAPSIAVVEVRNPDGQIGALPQAFTYVAAVNLAPAPTLTAVSPLRGPEAGGSLISVEGTNFAPGARVLFGTRDAGIEMVEPTRLFAISPPGQGDVALTVMNPDGQQATFGPRFGYLAPDALPPDPVALTTVAPPSGPTGGGTLVTLTGSGFTAPLEVLFGDDPASDIVVTAADTATARAPAHVAGVVDVVLIDDFGQVATLPAAYRFIPPPVLTSLSPNEAPVTGGRRVTLAGTGLGAGSNAPTVRVCDDAGAAPGAELGCVVVPVANVTLTSAAALTFTAPARAAGAADVVVTNPDGQRAVLARALTYHPLPTLASLTPSTGPTAGGTIITLSGTGFRAGAAVALGAGACTDVNVVNATVLRCTTAATSAGTVAATVTNPDGGSATLGSAFRFIPPPTIASITPDTGPESGGVQVTITGSGFATGALAAEVRFGNTLVDAAATRVISETALAVTLPAGTGIVDVTVLNPDGQQARRANGFTFVPPVPPPTISNAIPNRGSTAGGYLVQIVGSGFLSGASVFFGRDGDFTPATVLAVENAGTLLQVTAPARAAGTVDVRVRNTDGQQATVAGVFTYVAPVQTLPLAVTSLTPSRGGLAGGSIISIAGQGFRAGVQVFFARGAIENVANVTEFISPSLLQVEIPSAPGGLAGAVNVRVANPPTVAGPDQLTLNNAFEYTNEGLLTLGADTRLPPEISHEDRVASVADFTGDGLNDLLVFRAGTARLLVNTPPTADQPGYFAIAGSGTPNHEIRTSATGDIDEDGDLDYAFWSASDGRIYFCTNNGVGTFACSTPIANNNCPVETVELSDLNCDGHLDLFVGEFSTSTSCPNRLFLGLGDGGFFQARNRMPNFFENTRNAAMGDVDNDGDVDMLLANDDAMQNRLHYNNCNNRPSLNAPPPSPTQCWSDESYLSSTCTQRDFNGRRYSFCTQQGFTQDSARRDCRLRGGDLATINDVAERAFLRDLIGGNQVWVSLSDAASEGTFRWADGAAPNIGPSPAANTVTQTADRVGFCGGEPQGGTGENCVAMNGTNVSAANQGCMFDAGCNNGFFYVCETPLPTCTSRWTFTDATYGAGRNFPISGGNTKDVALVDVNEDGFLDAIIGNNGQQSNVHINTGGTFAIDDGFRWPQNEPNPNVQSLNPADIDNDGDVDMIAFIAGANNLRSIRVYANDFAQGGTGRFTDATSTAWRTASGGLRGDANAIAVGDFDADFLPDIYVVNVFHQDRLLMNNGFREGSRWQVADRVGNGRFEFNTTREVVEEAYNGRGIDFGDIDGDGDPDAVKCGFGVPLRILINDGFGALRNETSTRMNPTPNFNCGTKSIKLADMDNDGDRDLIWALRGGRWRMALNDGAGRFTDVSEANVPDVNIQGASIVTADFDGDDDLDVWFDFIEFNCCGRQGRIFMNGGDPFSNGGVFMFDVTSTYFPLNNNPLMGRSTVVFDVNGDKLPDMYMAREGQNQLFINNGNRTFSDATSNFLPALSDDSRDAVLVDFDNDDDLDIYVANNGQDRYLVRESTAKFADITSSALPNNDAVRRNTMAVVAADLNGDDLPEVVTINFDQAPVLLPNLGTNAFALRAGNIPNTLDQSYDAALVDIDSDGDLDVYVVNDGQDRLFINASPAATTATLPGDFQCANPQVLSTGELLELTGTTSGSGARSGSCGGAGAPEQVWRFTATQAGLYDIETTGFDTVLYVNTDCNGNELACDDDFGPASGSHVTVNLSSNQSVLVVVDGFAAEAGAYELSITRR